MGLVHLVRAAWSLGRDRRTQRRRSCPCLLHVCTPVKERTMLNGSDKHHSAQELARQLGGRKEGDNWKARCPAHDDRVASLSISEGQGGKVLVKCHAGCTQEALIDALRAKGCWSHQVNNGERRRTPKDQGRHIVAVYDYTDQTGHLLFQTVRYEPKAFRQRRPDGSGGYVWNLKGVPPV